jgi:hypothetical protein
MREVLVDVLKHTTSLGILETLKVSGSDEETLIESMAADNSVIFKAYLKEPIKEFQGEFGMTNLGILKGLTDFAPFMTDNATVSVKRETRNGKEFPVEIIFKDEEGRPAHFRMVTPDLVPNQPKAISSNWDINFEPTKSKIQELSKLASIFSSTEDFFFVKNVDGELRFYIGEEGSSSHRSYVVFNKSTEGTLNGLYWLISQILNVLKLVGENTQTKISIMNRGLLQIQLETTYATYLYMLPAKKK